MLYYFFEPLLEMSRHFLGISKRQSSQVIAGPECYSVCDIAAYAYQSIGTVPPLCDPNGDFVYAMDQCAVCIDADTDTNDVKTTVQELDDALAYCASIGSPVLAPASSVPPSTTTSVAAVGTSAVPGSTTAPNTVVIATSVVTSAVIQPSTSVVVVSSTSVVVATSQAPVTSAAVAPTSATSSPHSNSQAPPTSTSSQAPAPGPAASSPSSSNPTTLKTSISTTTAATSSNNRQSSSSSPVLATSIFSVSTSSSSLPSSSSSSSSSSLITPIPNANPTSKTNPSTHSISTGEVVGIAVGAAAISICIFALILFLIRRHRKNTRNAAANSEAEEGSRARPSPSSVAAAATLQQRQEKAQLHGDDYRAELSAGKIVSRIRTVGGLEELEWDPTVMQRRSDFAEHEHEPMVVAELRTTTGSPPPQYALWSDGRER